MRKFLSAAGLVALAIAGCGPVGTPPVNGEVVPVFCVPATEVTRSKPEHIRYRDEICWRRDVPEGPYISRMTSRVLIISELVQ